MNTEDMFNSLKKYSSEKPYLNTEMGQYTFQLGFEEGDKSATKAIIDKACEWLKFHVSIPCEKETTDLSAKEYLDWAKKRLEAAEEICNDFRKAMEK